MIFSGIKTDAGRLKSGYSFEKNDCTVRAYALAAEIDYKIAHAELFAEGRRLRHGFNVTNFYTQKFGNPFPRPKMSVATFINLIAHSGNWIVLIRGHVFAVINGVAHDIRPELLGSRHVLKAWQVK